MPFIWVYCVLNIWLLWILYLLFGGPDTGTVCPERLLPREYIQNAAGCGPEQLDSTDAALGGEVGLGDFQSSFPK